MPERQIPFDLIRRSHPEIARKIPTDKFVGLGLEGHGDHTERNDPAELFPRIHRGHLLPLSGGHCGRMVKTTSLAAGVNRCETPESRGLNLEQLPQLGGADVSAAADQSNPPTSKTLLELQGSGQGRCPGGFNQVACLFDHD